MTAARPLIDSEAVRTAAIAALVEQSSLYGRLDCDEGDEEELRDALSEAARWSLGDPARLARSFAEDSGMDVDAVHFEIADELSSIASDVHRRLVAEWVASGDAECTVADTVRVTARSGGETLSGCAFVVDRLAKLGQFAFVPDEQLPAWRHPEGGVTGYRIVDWEQVIRSEAPSDDDLALVDGQRRREQQEALRSTETRRRADARLAVEKRRKACEVNLAEAEVIWNELGLGGDVDRALRIHNAILLKLIHESTSSA